ncbi:nuclear transport factor 2 family protein [Nocardioides sp.]|uniref:nuclear transport factor 2 family protein n=1 Tax=Nocardioides sp. TaxID=35761 RepID=UPI003782E9CB
MDLTESEIFTGIHTLYSRYNWHLDIGDTDGMLALFLPEASITQPGPDGPVTASGAGGVRGVIEGWHSNPEQRGRQHQVTNIVVLPGPDSRPDQRSVRTFFIVTDGRDAPPSQLIWCGYSSDVVVLTGDGWRFLDREVGIWGPDAVDRFRAEGA